MQGKNLAKKIVSRREFLVGSGAVLAAGALTACSSGTASTVTNTVTSTVTKTGATAAAVTTTVTATGAATAAKYTCLSPRGYPKPVDKVPIVPRVDAAQIKTLSIWIIGQKGKGQGALTGIGTFMKANGYKITEDGKAAFFGSDEPALWDRAAKDAKAIIFGVGD